jgi:hypothetical protein
MKKIKYDIRITDDITKENGTTYKEVEGYHCFDMFGLSFGVSGGVVTELSTGLAVSRSYNTRKEAIKHAIEALEQIGMTKILELVELKQGNNHNFYKL